jgi:predicted RNA-binding protein with RPS1 domain
MPRHAAFALAALLVDGGLAFRADVAPRLARGRASSAFSMVALVESVEAMIEMPNKIPNPTFNMMKLKMPLNGIEPVGEGDASTDSEILPVIQYEAAEFSYEQFANSIKGFGKRVSKGDNCTGRVILIQPSGALIDIGTKASALLPTAEASLNAVDDLSSIFELGKSYDFQVITSEDENGQLQLSRKRLMYAEAWQKIDEMQAVDAEFEALVSSVNRGGAIVMVEGLRAFLPGSHLAGRTATEDMVGQKILCKFLDVDKENSRVVVSNRRAVVDKEMKVCARSTRMHRGRRRSARRPRKRYGRSPGGVRAGAGDRREHVHALTRTRDYPCVPVPAPLRALVSLLCLCLARAAYRDWSGGRGRRDCHQAVRRLRLDERRGGSAAHLAGLVGPRLLARKGAARRHAPQVHGRLAGRVQGPARALDQDARGQAGRDD